MRPPRSTWHLLSALAFATTGEAADGYPQRAVRMIEDGRWKEVVKQVAIRLD